MMITQFADIKRVLTIRLNPGDDIIEKLGLAVVLLGVQRLWPKRFWCVR
jgi:hypothetical protein